MTPACEPSLQSGLQQYKLAGWRQQVALLCYDPFLAGRRLGRGLASKIAAILERTAGIAKGCWEALVFRLAPSGPFLRFGLQVLGAGFAFLTMPGHLGVYAAESLSAASAPESAYTALGELSRQRAGQWRREHGFEDDRDFAYAFESYEEARANAGTLVAEDWASVRALDRPSLLGQVSQAVEQPAAAPPRRQSTFLMRVVSRGRLVQPPRPGRAPAPLVEQGPSEAQLDALAEALFSLGALKPRGQMTAKLEDEWRAALRRRVTARAGSAEKGTIRGALLTWSELQVHMADRGRDFPPDEVDVDAFLFGGTEAQSRALAGLKWLAKAGGLGYDLSGYSFKADVHREPKQAAVLEPPMVRILERAIQQRFEADDPSWRALLGLWCCSFGVLRFAHVNRSRPMRLSKSTFHFHCVKGKQHKVRSGFDFAVPGFFISGWDWGSRWLADWRALPSGAQANSGIAFNQCLTPLRRQFAWHRMYSHRCWARPSTSSPVILSAEWGRLIRSWLAGPRTTSSRLGTGRTKASVASSPTPCPSTTARPATPPRSGASTSCVLLWDASWSSRVGMLSLSLR